MTPWTVSCRAPLSMALSRQEYWSGVAISFSGDLLNLGGKLVSLVSLAIAGGLLTTELATWEVLTKSF